MKTKLLMLLMALSLFANEDLMNVKIKENIILKNGFGSISGKPILNDKSLEEKVALRGQFNVDENNNAVFEFDKLEHDGKIYNLNNAFVKKGRLKSADITLKKDSNLTVSGGNKDEILEIINAVQQESESDSSSDENKSNSNNYAGLNNGYGSSNQGQGFSPYQLDENDTQQNNGTDSSSSNNTKLNDALVVECPTASFDGVLATYYIQLGTVCTKRTSTSVEKIYNSKSCLNKIDYKNNIIELGYELFAHDPEGGSFMVQRCEYEEPITMISSTQNCKGLPNYIDKTVTIQKQYSYTWENKTNNVGQCTPIDEVVPLKYDINACEDERHDFEKNVSVEQAEYFYEYENEKEEIGSCVDIPQYTYTHYLDNNTCKYQVKDGRVFYMQRIAYDDLNSIQHFATDCQVTNSGGFEVFEEFAGYEYQDSSKQALRKINQYFFIPGTTTKEYITQDIVTDVAYPYIEENCGFTHDDTTLQSTYKSQVYFNDTHENKTITIQACQVKQIIPYTLINGGNTVSFNKSLGFQRLAKKADGTYHFYNDATKVIDITTGVVPVLKGGSANITNTSYTHYWNGGCIDGINVSYGSCVGGDIITSTAYYFKQHLSNVMDNEVCVNDPYSTAYTAKTCKFFDYWEEVGEYTNQATYLRGDGTTFDDNSNLLYRIIK